MIKYKMNKGDLEELEIRGDIAELTADISMLYQTIAEKIKEDGGDIAYTTFRRTLRHGLDAVDGLITEAYKKPQKDMEISLLAALLELEEFRKKIKADAYADAEGFNDEDEE